MYKIVVIGPESTGKSTLCEQLAAHFKTSWCPEFAREYLVRNGGNYTYEDLVPIARGQLALEESVSVDENGLLFIDTDMYVMQVWSEFVFQRCDTFILQAIAERHYDLYLLCDIDLPWAADDLREYPDLRPRQELFGMYKELLTEQHRPWVQISGDYATRLQLAIEAVQRVTGIRG